jgi:ATP-dependent protease ClpP protease subunit
MKYILKRLLSAVILLTCSSISFAGEWTIVDKGTIRFEGYIEESDIARFDEIMNKDIDTLIVRSGGGDVLAAIPIAEKIQKKNMDIVVDGLCVSSCADYFFIAAKRKKVSPNSLVLLHGGITAKLEHDSEKMIEEMAGLGAKLEQVELYMKRWREGAKKEQEIYKNAGVDIALMEYTHIVTDRDYDYWAPPPETFKKLGVKDITEFWYPSSDKELNDLAHELYRKYSHKYSGSSPKLSILGGDINKYKP